MKPHFPDLLSVTEYRSDRWFLNKSYRYVTLVLGFPWTIVVPTHFQTDLASIPRIFQSVIPKVGRHRGPAVIHDWLTMRNPSNNQRGKDGITRSQADKIFYEAMVASDVSRWKRTLMYSAVSLNTMYKTLKGDRQGGRG